MTWIHTVEDELRKCTDCGLCLSSCPSFTLTRAEGDSPRGRVHLLDLAQLGAAPDSVAAHHLGGCIECGACHAPCPTGVHVATARQAHRSATERLDTRDFERRVAHLAELIERDPGAALTIHAVRDVLKPPPDTTRETRSGNVLLLFGPMLRQAAPALAHELETRISASAADLIHDPTLARALERASGLLRDVGLIDEHQRAVADAAELLTARGDERLTVVVFDLLDLRLRDLPLPTNLRVVPAHQAYPPSDAALEHGAVWDHPADSPNTLLGTQSYFEGLPAVHQPAGAPVLLSDPALRVLADVITAKRVWLAGRTLLTMDARALVRFSGARHVGEFLVPLPDTVGEK